ncbi:Prefoldin alpha subunit [Dacryopinax primogenitus]|uniref:Prefoldin alpha subunit n=1 Tax=Dacryopinax primogenitus (strain DJM 731) TaxID=1858805 RepID=M5FP10_DACPD|nr:Prefoldin alpha subunit [Dacryopinax primogenitus]EJT98135.1 Prefoldin alpha subunit [Dacryopinax primogenitus]
MSQQTQSVSVTDLELPQLQDVKRQLDEEISHLTNSYAQLKQAHSKFKTCLDCVKEVRPGNARKTILVPLSSSLYVNGKLSDPEKVLIDVGTGYYVSKVCLSTPTACHFNLSSISCIHLFRQSLTSKQTRDQAASHYQQKIEFVDGNLKKVQETIEKKQENLNLVLQVMQMRMGQAGGAKG